MKLLLNIGRLFTSTERGVIEKAAVVLDGDRIAWAGPELDLPAGLLGEDIEQEGDLGGALVTPGLIDAHTHPVYGGNRYDEIARRTAGASYGDLAATGGGIASTVRETRASETGELRAGALDRFQEWLTSGTTTVEGKSGYHLDRAGELSTIDMLSDMNETGGLPRVAVTFLGAHALPPDGPSSLDDYAAEVSSWCVEAAAQGAKFCDVFCDEGYFTVEQARRILTAGAEVGLVPRVHADELAHSGGAQLAAELHAASADHLLYADDSDARALAKAGVTATLAPVTALTMGRMPPTRELLDAGATIALGSDHNPGTSGVTDMTVVIALAVSAFGMSVDHALGAATRGGAMSLRRSDLGVIEQGALADIVVWDAEHEGAFAWAYGLMPLALWLAGEEMLVELDEDDEDDEYY